MNNEEKFKESLKNLLDEKTFSYDADNWEKASEMLDEDDKRRRGFFWLLYTGIGLSILVLTLLYFNYTSTQPEKDSKSLSFKKETVNLSSNAEKKADQVKAQLVEPINKVKPKETITSNKPQAPVTPADKQVPAPPASNAPSGNQALPTKNNPHKVSVNTPALPQSNNSTLNTDPRPVNTNLTPGLAVENLTKANEQNQTPKPADADPQSAGEPNPTVAQLQERIRLNATTTSGDSVANLIPKKLIPNAEAPLSANSNKATQSTLPDSASIQAISATKKDSMAKTNPTEGLPKIIKSNYFFAEAGTCFNSGWNYQGKREGMGFNPYAGLSYHSSVSKKIGLVLGVYYASAAYLKNGQKTSSSTSADFGLQADAAAGTPAYPGQGLTLSYGSQKKVTTITPANLQYVMLPAKVQYEFKTNQAISLGYTFAYLFNVRSRVENYNESANTIHDKKVTTSNGYLDGFTSSVSQITLGYKQKLYRNFWFNSELYYGLSDLRDDAFFGIQLTERFTGLKLGICYNLYKQ